MITPETVPADTLAAIAAQVEARSGLRFVGGRADELATKLARAFAESECRTWPEYQAHISNGAPFEQLVETLTIGETYFYRHRPYFDMLEREILPEIVARRRASKRLRLWCAGCATGEEAYSLAIAVRTVLPDVDDWQISLVATDLNRAYLARAGKGLYGEWSFRETDAAFKATNFVAEGPRWRVRPEIRKLVRFTELNLAEEGYPSAANGTAGVDLIFFRNVLLYFGQDLAQRVIGRMRTALVPEGWLVLGPSDPRPGLLTDFNMRAGEGAVVYRPSETVHPAGDRSSENSLSGATFPLKLADQRPTPDSFGAGRLPDGDFDRPEGPPTSERSDAVGNNAMEGDWHAAWLEARASANGGQLDLAEEHCRQAISKAHLRPEPYYLLATLRLAKATTWAR